MVNGTLLSGSKALAGTDSVTSPAVLEAAGVTVECSGPKLRLIRRIILAIAHAIILAILGNCKSNTANCSESPEEISSVALLASEITLDGTLAVKGVVKPETKNVLATIKFEGASCALLGVQPVTGKVKALAKTGQDERKLQSVAISTETGDLKLGSSEAKASGTSEVELESGETWSFL
jgi:hypothetical protein